MVANPARIRIPATHRVAGVSMVAPSAPRDARSKTPPGPEGSNGIDRRGCRGKLAGPSPCVGLDVPTAHRRTGIRPWRWWQAAALWWAGARLRHGATRCAGGRTPARGSHRNLPPPDTQNAPCGALRISGGERGIHSALRASPFGRWLRHRATRCAGGRTPLGVLIATSLRQIRKTPLAGRFAYLAERGGFEPPKRCLGAYTLSRRAPSTTRTPLREARRAAFLPRAGGRKF